MLSVFALMQPPKLALQRTHRRTAAVKWAVKQPEECTRGHSAAGMVVNFFLLMGGHC